MMLSELYVSSMLQVVFNPLKEYTLMKFSINNSKQKPN